MASDQENPASAEAEPEPVSDATGSDPLQSEVSPSRAPYARDPELLADPGSMPHGRGVPAESRTAPGRRYWGPTVLAGAAGGVMVLLAIVGAVGSAGLFHWLAMLLAGVATLGAAFLFRRELAAEEFEIVREREGLDELRVRVEEGMTSFERKRLAFEDRLLTYGEWMEFPEAISFGDTDEARSAVFSDTEGGSKLHAERDREVALKVQAASEAMLAKFREDHYSQGGRFQPRLLLQDILDFIEEIALVYRPGSTQPILETSVERILKAVNRISLQLLFQLEQIPLNLKDYQLATAYDHVRRASRLHGYYKTVSPYLPIANYTWHLGKLIAGTNPISAGTWFLGSEVLRRGGAKISKRYVDHYSLKLTAEAMRILGNEAAVLFDEDYRYREPSWIYGVELVDLVHRFPLSRETLQKALDEVGRLTLRSSYDRVFLYRCLAAHSSPRPGRFARPDLLRDSERRDIARRLEQFFEDCVHGKQPDEVDAWRSEVSARLGVAIHVRGARGKALDSAAQVQSALESIASYLRSVKALETVEIASHLRAASLAGQAEPEELEHLASTAAEFFEYPDLEPGSEILHRWFEDLLELERGLGVMNPRAVESLRRAADYFRMTSDPVQRVLGPAYQELLGTEMEADSPESSIPSDLLFPLAEILPEQDRPRFFYSASAPKLRMREGSGEEAGGPLEPFLPAARWWIMATGRRIVLLAVDSKAEAGDPGQVSLVWSAERSGEDRARLDREKGVMGSSGLLYGGTWHVPMASAPDPIRIPGQRLSRFEKYFGPLVRWTDQQTPDGASP